MTAGRPGMPTAFRRALVFSAILHVGLIVLIAASPNLSRPPKKGMTYYVNFIGGGGGTGGGPGGGTVSVKTEPPPPAPAKKETLRDLTVPQKVQPEAKSTLRYPVDKPKKDKKTSEKKAAITKPQPSPASPAATSAAPAAASGQEGGTGGGYGLRFGTGGPGGGGTGGGLGPGSGEPYGVAGFPFTYYLQMISDKITGNWFQSLVDPGTTGLLQTQVYFKIFRNGQVADLKVEISSGISAFDLSAMRAVQASGPFPALPSEYDGQYLGIHLVFEHSK